MSYLRYAVRLDAPSHHLVDIELAWLDEPHPGAQVLATVTTTARWV